jgi:hypothetical protein
MNIPLSIKIFFKSRNFPIVHPSNKNMMTYIPYNSGWELVGTGPDSLKPAFKIPDDSYYRFPVNIKNQQSELSI